jgi:hypothetical protein
MEYRALMMALSFIIEVLVVRHYGLAVVFITPLTILLAEAATLGHGCRTSSFWRVSSIRCWAAWWAWPAGCASTMSGFARWWGAGCAG